ncbi:hypothetical protein ABEB36_004090 [Hypothenemus hampei]|uniref:Uncharacterized protein n=1 Tax=Hypothenemus hampei TaxID=57062 RepID=A0ABD1F282_HYPHA
MTLERHKETLLTKNIVGSSGPEPARCMTSQRRKLTCYRTTKFSSNRHRKLQPFRETINWPPTTPPAIYNSILGSQHLKFSIWVTGKCLLKSSFFPFLRYKIPVIRAPY